MHEDLFKNNPLVKELRLSNNKLTCFDGKLFQFTPALKELKLSNSFITKFPFDNMPVLANLVTLYIVNNTLCNLNEEQIIDKFPNLRKMYVSSGIQSTVQNSIELYNRYALVTVMSFD